jgi:hypothetical protein
MDFKIVVEEFEDEVGKVWRGLILAGSRKMNFVLPLKPGSSYVEAETATVYELSKILPFVLDTADTANIICSSLLVTDRISSSSVILDNLKKFSYKLDVDESWMKVNEASN